MDNEIFWTAMASKMPETFPRKNVEALTGGLISAKVMANLDSAGKGPKVKVQIGKHVNYCREDFIEWLKSRSKAS